MACLVLTLNVNFVKFSFCKNLFTIKFTKINTGNPVQRFELNNC